MADRPVPVLRVDHGRGRAFPRTGPRAHRAALAADSGLPRPPRCPPAPQRRRADRPRAHTGAAARGAVKAGDGGLPLFAYGAAVNFLPYYLPGRLAGRMARPETDHATLRLFAGGAP